MEDGRLTRSSAAFLCSPIPKDPLQVNFVEDSSFARQSDDDNFLDSAELDGMTITNAAEAPRPSVAPLHHHSAIAASERDPSERTMGIVGAYSAKRQRREIESAADHKTETSNEHHDDVLKEKDRQIDQLRGQLQVAVAEADETLQELKTVTSDFSAEKLTLQKKVVELEAQMKLVEANMEEWKQKALESSAQVRSVTRQLKLKEMDLSRQSMVVSEDGSKYEVQIDMLEKKLGNTQQENARLTKLLEKAEKEIAVFENRLGRGEFNAETTKVVHLSVNPTSETLSSQLSALRQENESLRSRLEKVANGGDTEVKSTPSSAASEPKFTTTTSYETVEGLKMLNKRLKEVFSDQIQHYREAISLLMGYKVDLRKSNGMELLRIRSIFADHDSDELLVRMETNGSLELLDTDFCSQIDQRVFSYLTTCRSFPAFLSTLTLSLFEKQTFQG